jgi:hypothetical protein
VAGGNGAVHIIKLPLEDQFFFRYSLQRFTNSNRKFS